MYGEEVMSMLTVQYRMHELIMDWSSKELYNSKVLRFSLDVCSGIIIYLFLMLVLIDE